MVIKNFNRPVCKNTFAGNKCWYLNNDLHREDGPAVEWANGDKSWYFHSKLHRLDGPAIEYANGSKSWWYHGERINCSSQEEFERLIRLKVLW